jgi:hypothetical protein
VRKERAQVVPAGRLEPTAIVTKTIKRDLRREVSRDSHDGEVVVLVLDVPDGFKAQPGEGLEGNAPAPARPDIGVVALIRGELNVARSDRHEPDERSARQSRFLEGEDVATAQGGEGDRAVLAPPAIAGARVPQRIENCVEAGQRRDREVAVRAAGEASTGSIPEELRSDADIEASRSARLSALVGSRCGVKDVRMTRIHRVCIGLSLEEATFALLTLGQLLRRKLLRLLRDNER